MGPLKGRAVSSGRPKRERNSSGIYTLYVDEDFKVIS